MKRVDINVKTRTHPQAPLVSRPRWSPDRQFATFRIDQTEQLSDPSQTKTHASRVEPCATGPRMLRGAANAASSPGG